MEACTTVEALADVILSKFGSFTESHSNLQSLISHLTTLQQELLAGVSPNDPLSIPAVMMFEQSIKKLRDHLNKEGAEHRDIHSSVSKCGREIDRQFTHDFSLVCSPCQSYESDANPRQKEVITKLVAEHFLTQGQLDLADSLAQEANLELERSKTEMFVEINRIIESINEHNLHPVRSWAESHHAELEDRRSQLEFRIEKLHFIQLLKLNSRDQTEIIRSARSFERFADSHRKEIQTLMGSLLYVPTGLQSSPYAHLLDPVLWAELADLFTKEACGLLGLSVTSPLCTILNAGVVTVPALLNIRKGMELRHVQFIFETCNELPVEAELGPDCRFHSVFTCPILRQPTTELNPPMRLYCGHVISRDALHKLANSNAKLKCPYCPVESVISDAKTVYF